MMVSGARKGFWVCRRMKGGGLGGGALSLSPNGEREKPPSDCSRRIAVLRPLRSAAAAADGRRSSSAESGSFEGPEREHCGFAAVAAGFAGLCPAGQSGQAPLMSAAEQARQDARFNSLFFGPWRLYAPPFPPPRRSPFSAARRSGARRGDGRKTCCRGRRRIGTS